jgi:hypothetical protein
MITIQANNNNNIFASNYNFSNRVSKVDLVNAACALAKSSGWLLE